MDNKEWAVLREQVRQITEDPLIKKLRDNKAIILLHLSQPAHKLLEEYLLSRRLEIQNQLNYRWINGAGQDISNLLRGKLEALDTILDLKNMFERMDKMEQKLKDLEKGAK